MSRVLVKGEPYLLGDYSFKKNENFGLLPGTKISVIGDDSKGITSSNRIDRFIEPAIYSGEIKLTEGEYSEDFLAFRLPDNLLEGNQNKRVYKLYSFCESNQELIVSNYNSQTVRIYKATFKTSTK